MLDFAIYNRASVGQNLIDTARLKINNFIEVQTRYFGLLQAEQSQGQLVKGNYLALGVYT